MDSKEIVVISPLTEQYWLKPTILSSINMLFVGKKRAILIKVAKNLWQEGGKLNLLPQ